MTLLAITTAFLLGIAAGSAAPWRALSKYRIAKPIIERIAVPAELSVEDAIRQAGI
jgi:hypothetical protein